QLECLVQHAYGQLHVLLVDDHRNLDFGGRDHLDVDAFLGQRAEHLAGDADVRAHADADHRYLGGLVVADDGARLQRALGLQGLEDVEGIVHLVLVYGEGEIGGAVGGHVLDDDVDIDVGVGNRAQDLEGGAGAVGHAEYRDLGFVAVEGDAGNDR